jgi:hypothetical protein
MVSSPATSVPEWNLVGDGFLDSVFDFASPHIQDDGVLLFFHSNTPKMKANIKGFMKAYHFSFFKECMKINHLQMTSGRDNSKSVNESCIVKFFELLDTSIVDVCVVDCISCFVLCRP